MTLDFLVLCHRNPVVFGLPSYIILFVSLVMETVYLATIHKYGREGEGDRLDWVKKVREESDFF